MTLLLINSLMVQAAPTLTNHNNMDTNLLVSYDMSIGGTQTFELEDSAGNSYVKISEIPSMTRVGNGTYQVEHVRAASWRAGYFIVVSNNRVTSAYGQYCYPVNGSIISDYLSVDSSVQVTYSFVHKVQSIYTRCGLYSVISNGNINVYGL